MNRKTLIQFAHLGKQIACFILIRLFARANYDLNCNSVSKRERNNNYILNTNREKNHLAMYGFQATYVKKVKLEFGFITI